MFPALRGCLGGIVVEFIFSVLSFVNNFWAGGFEAVTGLASFAGIFRLLLIQWRASQPVTVTLCLQGDEGGREETLPLEMRRRDVTRPEILGRLGMLPMRQKGRFAIRSLSRPEFIRSLNRVADGKTSVLVIPVTEEELEQFDLE